VLRCILLKQPTASTTHFGCQVMIFGEVQSPSFIFRHICILLITHMKNYVANIVTLTNGMTTTTCTFLTKWHVFKHSESGNTWKVIDVYIVADLNLLKKYKLYHKNVEYLFPAEKKTTDVERAVHIKGVRKIKNLYNFLVLDSLFVISRLRLPVCVLCSNTQFHKGWTKWIMQKEKGNTRFTCDRSSVTF
jgi:hypothetical protein